MNAHQGAVQWYTANGANTAAGSIVLTESVGEQRTLEVWRGCAAHDKTVIPLNVAGPTDLVISRQGRYAVAARLFSGAEVLDLDRGESLAYLPNCYGTAEFSPDQRIALLVCLSGGIRVYDVATRELAATALFDPRDSVTSLAVDNEFKHLAVGGGSGKLILLDVRSTPAGVDVTNPRVLDEGHHEWISGLEFSDDASTLYSVSRDGQLDVWSVGSGARLDGWKTELSWVGTVTFFRKATRVIIYGAFVRTGLEKTAAVVIDTATGQRRVFETVTNYLWGAYIPRDDALFVAGFWTVPWIEPDISVIDPRQR